MKPSSFIVAVSALMLINVCASGAPPRGHGGGQSMGGGLPAGMPGGISSHADVDRTAHEQASTTTGRQNVGELLSDNTKLASHIKDLTGTNAQQACAGFEKLGECVSAAHASKNLGIAFDSLRAKLPGRAAESLGKVDPGAETGCGRKGRSAQSP